MQESIINENEMGKAVRQLKEEIRILRFANDAIPSMETEIKKLKLKQSIQEKYLMEACNLIYSDLVLNKDVSGEYQAFLDKMGVTS